MLEHLITSRTRLRLLVKFFVYEGTEAYLRELAKEFGDSTNAVRVELNRLTDIGMLERSVDGNRKFYRANPKHQFFADTQYIVRRYIGWYDFEQVIMPQRENIKCIYMREVETDGAKFEYVVATKGINSDLDLSRAESLGLKVKLEDNIEERRDPHTPCFLIWMNSAQNQDVMTYSK